MAYVLLLCETVSPGPYITLHPILIFILGSVSTENKVYALYRDCKMYKCFWYENYIDLCSRISILVTILPPYTMEVRDANSFSHTGCAN